MLFTVQTMEKITHQRALPRVTARQATSELAGREQKYWVGERNASRVPRLTTHSLVAAR